MEAVALVLAFVAGSFTCGLQLGQVKCVLNCEAHRQEPGALRWQVALRRGPGGECLAVGRCGGHEPALSQRLPGGRGLRPAERHVHLALRGRGAHHARHRHLDGPGIHPGAPGHDAPATLPPAEVEHFREGGGGCRPAEALGALAHVGRLRLGQHHRRLLRACLGVIRLADPRELHPHLGLGLHLIEAVHIR